MTLSGRVDLRYTMTINGEPSVTIYLGWTLLRYATDVSLMYVLSKIDKTPTEYL